MSHNATLTAVALVLLALGTATQTAQAQVFTETADAGVTIPTSILLPGGITTVNGTISARGDLDLFAFYLDTSNTVTFLSNNSPFDDNLLLFNGNGQGIGASDDQGGGPDGLDSRITIALTPGLYYIGAGVNNIEADTDNGTFIFDDDFGDSNGVIGGPTALSIGFLAQQSGGQTGSYTLTFSTATANAPTAVPEPGSIALLAGMGAVGAGFLRRRKQSRG